LEISLTQNWLIFVTRGGNTRPSWQLVGAIFGVDVLATLFCVFGWIAGSLNEVHDDPFDHATFTDSGRTSIVTVVIVWCYSIAVTIVLAIIYYLLNQVRWLNELGRKTRSHRDTKIENMIIHLSKLAIEHERDDATGRERYHIVPKADEEDDD
jgi:H+-transporting ATPase